jgi:hypothetical protein
VNEVARSGRGKPRPDEIGRAGKMPALQGETERPASEGGPTGYEER